MKEDYPELIEIDNESLKRKLIELEAKVAHYENILEENDLLDTPKTVSKEEYICLKEIEKLKQVSDKGAFTLEDTKVFDLLVKNLLAIRGKAPVEKESKKGKRGPMPVADLLKIVEGGGKGK